MRSFWLIYGQFQGVLGFRKKLEDVEREKAFFTNTFALVSHHMKSPLSAALLTTRALRFTKDEETDTYTINEKQYQRLLSSIESSVDLAEYMVANQKKVNVMVEKESMTLQSLAASVADQKSLLQPSIESQFEQHISPVEAFVVHMALETFVQNSLEHAKMKPELTVQENFTIQIKDQGKGLPAAMFDKFGAAVQGSASNRGIGIYHTKRLLNSVGWDFKLVSESGFCAKIFRVKELETKTAAVKMPQFVFRKV
jgi:signal transduction histidine kinase